jgi:hypothetical protein
LDKEIDGNCRVYQFTAENGHVFPEAVASQYFIYALGELLQVAKITLNGSGKLVI